MWELLFQSLSPAGPHAKLSVLIFHRVLPRPDLLLQNEPDALSFERQMQWVQRWFNVLPLDEAVKRLARGSLPARALSITFDDGYADNYHVACPILQRLGLTATFFIATGFMNKGRMWNDTVIETVRALEGSSLELDHCGLGSYRIDNTEHKRATIASLLGKIKYLPNSERATTIECIAERSPVRLPENLMMSSAEVKELHRRGMTIGAHTVSHPILCSLAPETAHSEILESKSVLEDIIGEEIGLFAYPNGKPGRDYHREHVAMVAKLRFSAAVSTSWGIARTGDDVYQIPRFTPWDRQSLRYGLRLAQNLMRSNHDNA